MGFGVVSILVALTGYITFIHLEKISQPVSEEMPKLMQDLSNNYGFYITAQFIRYYDEVLTQSARNYAFTGDSKWKERYNKFEPLLEKKIQEAIAKGSENDKLEFGKVDESNIALANIEHQALKLVDDGKRQEAIDVLNSEAYWQEKTAFEEFLRKYSGRQGSDIEEGNLAYLGGLESKTINVVKIISNAKKAIFLFVIFIFALSLSIGLLFSHYISLSINRLTRAVEDITKGNLHVQLQNDSGLDEIKSLINSLNRILASMKLAILRVSLTQESFLLGKSKGSRKPPKGNLQAKGTPSNKANK